MKKIALFLLLIIFGSAIIFSEEDAASSSKEKKVESKKEPEKKTIPLDKKLKAAKITRLAGISTFIPGVFFTTMSFPMLIGAELCQAEYEYYEEYGFPYATEFWGWNDIGKDSWYNLYNALYYSSFSFMGVGGTLLISSMSLLIASAALELSAKKQDEEGYKNSNIKRMKPWIVTLVTALTLSIPSTILIPATAVVLAYLYLERTGHDFYGLKQRIFLKGIFAGLAAYAAFDIISIPLFVMTAVFLRKQKKERKISLEPSFDITNTGCMNVGLNLKY